MSLELQLVRAWKRYLEHLGGKHNQKSHGRKGGGEPIKLYSKKELTKLAAKKAWGKPTMPRKVQPKKAKYAKNLVDLGNNLHEIGFQDGVDFTVQGDTVYVNKRTKQFIDQHRAEYKHLSRYVQLDYNA